MASCKDCIHNVICSADAYFKEREGAETACVHFKNEFNDVNTKYGETIKLLKQFPQLKANVEIAKMRVLIIEQAIKSLNDEEAKIIDALFFKGENPEAVAFNINAERATFYRKRNVALDKITVAMNGGGEI